MSSLLWRKMLVTFVAAFVPLFGIAVVATLTEIANGLGDDSIDWRVILISFLASGLIPALAAGVRAVLAVGFNLTPTDALHGRNAKEVVAVTTEGATATEPPTPLPGEPDAGVG